MRNATKRNELWSSTKTSGMGTVTEVGNGVPAFLAKLWKLVEDNEFDNFICWSSSGRSFIIKDQAKFAKELLPHYYKHNNMASFIRQLNMYGFHKKASVELGGLKCDKDEMEFAHQFFQKGQPYLLEHIKRKIASNKNQDTTRTPIKQELMSTVLTEVRNMKGRQENLDTKLAAIKNENEALWREIAMLRQKHIKQQQIVNKLIQFLVTLVQPTSRGGGLSVKRRYPLMIDDDTNRAHKQSKLSKSQASPTGPIIHEVDASEPDMDSEYIVAEMLESAAPIVHSPEEYIQTIDDENMENIQLVENPETTLLNDVTKINSNETDTRKKRLFKGKKKRKNKVPVKILIPSLENGGKPREEMHMLEMPIDDETPVSIAFLKKEPIVSKPKPKPVPAATMRSSKLMAMAANINESQKQDTYIMENAADMEDDTETSDNDASMMKLHDILIVPEIINNSNFQSIIRNKESYIKDLNQVNKGLEQINNRIALSESSIEQHHENGMLKFLQEEKDDENKASTSSKDLSLSCMNSDISETNYREHMDNHVETIQSDLENLREILRCDAYSIDANTLIGLFGADDPLTYGIPINSELNPTFGKDNVDNITNSINGSAGGELMTYNPPNLLDFDDDMLLENASSPLPTSTSNLSADNLYMSELSSDPLDDKTLLYDSLVKFSNNNLKS